jgi:hypothetical protein
MVVGALVMGLVKAMLPIAVARAIWWLVEDLVLDRMDLPF